MRGARDVVLASLVCAGCAERTVVTDVTTFQHVDVVEADPGLPPLERQDAPDGGGGTLTTHTYAFWNASWRIVDDDLELHDTHRLGRRRSVDATVRIPRKDVREVREKAHYPAIGGAGMLIWGALMGGVGVLSATVLLPDGTGTVGRIETGAIPIALGATFVTIGLITLLHPDTDERVVP